MLWHLITAWIESLIPTDDSSSDSPEINEDSDDSDDDEDVPNPMVNYVNELLSNSVIADPLQDLKLVSFELSSFSERPHCKIKFSPDDCNRVTLLDHGSKHNLISLKLLQEVEKLQNTTFDLQPCVIQLESHTKNPIMVLGQTKLSFLIEDTVGTLQQLSDEMFVVTEEEEARAILGIYFFAGRSGQLNTHLENGVVNFELLITLDRKQLQDFEWVYDIYKPSPIAGSQLKLANTTKFAPGESRRVNLSADSNTIKLLASSDKICHISVVSLLDEHSALCRFDNHSHNSHPRKS